MRIVTQFRDNVLALYRINVDNVNDAENTFLTELEHNHLIGSEKAINYFDREVWNRYLTNYQNTAETGRCIQENNRKRRAEELKRDELVKKMKAMPGVNAILPKSIEEMDLSKVLDMMQNQLVAAATVAAAAAVGVSKPPAGVTAAAVAAPATVGAVAVMEKEKLTELREDREVEEGEVVN